MQKRMLVERSVARFRSVTHSKSFFNPLIDALKKCGSDFQPWLIAHFVSKPIPARARRALAHTPRAVEPLESRVLMTTLYWAPTGPDSLGGSGTWDATTANWTTSPDGKGTP